MLRSTYYETYIDKNLCTPRMVQILVGTCTSTHLFILLIYLI